MERLFIAEYLIDCEKREQQKNQKARLIWLTGLSGAGKTTIARLLDMQLVQQGFHTYYLDGDNMRSGLCRDLSFDAASRKENIRRAGEVGKLMVDAGLITIAAFISPFREDRGLVRTALGNRFIEVYCKCPLSLCEERDIKGLYRQARAGRIKDFTGISSPYEEPDNPALILNTDVETPEQSVERVLQYLAATQEAEDR